MEISVIIPLFNKKEGILRALDSVFCQTYSPREIIVVNDGSTDGSEIIVQELNHPLIRLVNQKNAGVSAARNKGIEMAQSEWVAFLDADDYWENEFLQEINKTNRKSKNSSLIFSKYRIFSNENTFNVYVPLEKEFGICDNYFKLAALYSPPIWTGAVVVKKSIIKKVGFFNPLVTNGEDLLLWAKIAANFEIVYVRSVLSNYQMSISLNKHQKLRLPDKHDIVSNELLKLKSTIFNKCEYRYLIKYISKWHKMRLHQYAQNYMFSFAVTEYLKSIKYNFFVCKTHFILPFYFIKYLIGHVSKPKIRTA